MPTPSLGLWKWILLMIQLYVTIDFKKGRVSWSNHVSLLKTVFPTWLQKGNSEIWSTRFHVPLLAWRWRRPHGKECRCPLGAESSPQLKTSKEMLTSVLKLQKKLNSANNQVELQSKFFPRPPEKHSLADILLSACETLSETLASLCLYSQKLWNNKCVLF